MFHAHETAIVITDRSHNSINVVSGVNNLINFNFETSIIYPGGKITQFCVNYGVTQSYFN